MTEEEKVRRGIQGVQGIQGIQGPSGGEDGPPGEDGVDGTPGEDGVMGRQGLPGNEGDRGQVGAEGHVGDRGPRGKEGNPGTTGLQGEPAPSVRAFWIVFPIALSIVALCFAVFYLYQLAEETRKVTENTNILLRAELQASSPESVEQRAAAVQEIIVQVDCNNRQALQELVDEINNSSGIFGETNINVVDNCPEEKSNNG